MSTGAYSEYSIQAMLPEWDGDDLEELHVVAVAQQEAEVMGDGSEVNVVDDEMIARPVVELAGKAALMFPCSSILGHVMLHIKNQERFMRIEVEVVDDSAGENGYRTLRFDNRRSIATVTPELAEMPLVMNTGWQFLDLDLEDLVFAAYGTAYLKTVQVRVSGGCRVGKVYLADRVYADAELPVHLRTLKPPPIGLR